jgi:hypothetical protein
MSQSNLCNGIVTEVSRNWKKLRCANPRVTGKYFAAVFFLRKAFFLYDNYIYYAFHTAYTLYAYAFSGDICMIRLKDLRERSGWFDIRDILEQKIHLGMCDTS